jgi:hypothetical protein
MFKNFFVVTGLLFVLSSCQKEAMMHTHDMGNTTAGVSGMETERSSSGTTYYGNKIRLGMGQIRTYVNLNSQGKPVDVGIEFSESAINTVDMPMKHTAMHDMSYDLRFHPNATKDLPYDHVSLDWATMGHGPEGVYDVPHFDVHFYMISSMKQMDIITDRQYPVGPEAFTFKGPSTIPLSYFPGPFVEMMGTHWISKDEFGNLMSGREVFKHTFIYGTHEDELIFLEPMITLETLRSKQNIVKDIDQPNQYPIANRYYATQYGITYNSKTRMHRVSLLGNLPR